MYSFTVTLPASQTRPEVVALQVDEHDVLGALLRMRHQLGTVAQLLLDRRRGARGCRRSAASRHRALRCAAAVPVTMKDIVMPPKWTLAANGRGIGGAQRRVDARRVGHVAQLQAPGSREVRLVDVARGDVFLGRAHARQVSVPRASSAAPRAAAAPAVRRAASRGRLAQAPRSGARGRRDPAGGETAKHDVARQIMHGKVLDAQCECRETGVFGARKPDAGLDLRRDLVTEIDDPPGGERQRVRTILARFRLLRARTRPADCREIHPRPAACPRRAACRASRGAGWRRARRPAG